MSGRCTAYLAKCGSWRCSCRCCVSARLSENSFDVKRRAIAAATYNVLVQVGSLIGSQIYRKWDGPYYI
ncbi:hypothetical protein B0T17DRAFT_401437 [Bombardia bombarda]|uniref:Uncharacterized protein n=1 Tax=Bombardia bombarda TaxID=252184 RepID=A0AA39U6V0_9PEZI|nr:hypothetical protein B0T17DRAFT_401437 [Bombardia bombarda]